MVLMMSLGGMNLTFWMGKDIRLRKEKGRGSMNWLVCSRRRHEVELRAVCRSGDCAKEWTVVMEVSSKSIGSSPPSLYVEYYTR